MAKKSWMEAGSAPTLPGFEFARCHSKAPVQYQPYDIAAIELAAQAISIRFGLPACRSRTIAELAGMGGKP